MNILSAPLQYVREVFQGFLNEIFREDQRNLKRDVAETHQSSLKIMGLLDLSDAAAGQIKFPATQNPSSDANTFDDYEKGTWTPNLTDGTNAYTGQTTTGSTYTKNGNVVTLVMKDLWTGIGSVGASQLRASGAPFTAAEESGMAFNNYDGIDLTATLNPLVGFINGTSIFFRRVNDNAASTAYPANASSASGVISGTVNYRV